MIVNISYKNVETHAAVEKESAVHIRKLEKLLKTYQPDLVRLHCGIEQQARRIEFDVSLNLGLPNGTLHSTGTGADIRSCLKVGFAELQSQIKKHQARLRHDHEWKRKRPRPAIA